MVWDMERDMAHATLDKLNEKERMQKRNRSGCENTYSIEIVLFCQMRLHAYMVLPSMGLI